MASIHTDEPVSKAPFPGDLDDAILGRAVAQCACLVATIDKQPAGDRDFGALVGGPRGYLTATLRIVLTDIEAILDQVEGDMDGETIAGFAESAIDDLKKLLAAVGGSAL